MKISSVMLTGIATMALLGNHAEAIELASHRAVYELTLAKAQPSSGLTGASGRLVLEWREACDGSVSNQRLGLRADLAEGPSFVYDVTLSSWESADSTKLRFNKSSYDNGELIEQFRGEALLDRVGEHGIATFRQPSGTIQELPAGTLFPTQHIKALIEAAGSGELIANHHVFDGSGLDALATVTAVIGEPATAEDGEPHWPISLAYFKEADAGGMPEFEISFMLAADGVLTEVVLNYGDFVLNGNVSDIEKLPPPSCG